MTTTRRTIAALAITAASLLLAQSVAMADPTIASATPTFRCIRVIPLPAPGYPKQHVTPCRHRPHHYRVRLIPIGTPHAPTSRGVGA